MSKFDRQIAWCRERQEVARQTVLLIDEGTHMLALLRSCNGSAEQRRIRGRLQSIAAPGGQPGRRGRVRTEGRVKMLRLASLLVIFLPLVSTAYAACEGQPGEVVFEDTFADDLGGWTVHDDAKFANGELTLHNQDPNPSWLYWNNTFNVTDGDYCAEVVQPASATGDNVGSVGLLFLGEGDNTFLLQVNSDNTAALWKKASTAWAQLGTYSAPELKLSSGSPVTLRVIVKNGLIKPFVNGVEVRGTRAQVPKGPLKFGVYAQNALPVPAPGSDFVIKEIKITSGE